MKISMNVFPPITLPRRKTRQVFVKNIPIGGDAPIPVQTMVKVPTTNYDAVLRQIESTVTIDPEKLEEREKNILKELNAWMMPANYLLSIAISPVSVFRIKNPRISFARIVKNAPIPVVSDIHFLADMALAVLEYGTHKLRINPGNISNPVLLKRLRNWRWKRKCRSGLVSTPAP